MRRKYLNVILVFALIFTMFLPTVVQATTMGNYKSAEEVFPEEELKSLEMDVDQAPVMVDKKSENGLAPQSMGSYPRRKGVILVTKDKYKGLIPTGHAAIVYSHGTVVESLSGGVTTGNNNWNTTRTSCYGVTVSRTTAAQDEKAANWCYNQRRKPYNWNYLNPYTRNSFYCSQLVYAAFLDNYGINLDTSAFLHAVHPIELVDSGNTSKIYEK